MSDIERLFSALRGSLRDVDQEQFAGALDGVAPALAARPGERTQLRIRRLRFGGAKAGDFRFFAGVNVLRAGNDKGKSSVLKLIHYCLTGRNELKKDVDSWVDQVKLYFELDGRPFAVRVDKRRRPSGQLLECDPEQPEELDRARIVSSWKSGAAMQRELETFFNQAFGLRPLAGTQKDSRKASDQLLDSPTSYRAYVRGLYITQDLGYTDLITDGVPYGNLFMKIVGMLLGIRGLDGYFAVEARLAHVDNLLAKEERYHRRLEASLGLRDLATLDEEIDKLERYIDDLKVERTALFVRATSNDLDRRLRELTERAIKLDHARAKAGEVAHRAAQAVAETEQNIADLESALASEQLLTPIVPTHWPAFDLELTDEQRQQLGRRLEERSESVREAITGRLQLARDALQAEQRAASRRRADLQEIEFKADQIGQQRGHLQAQLRSAYQGTSELEREIELETRYLGRLEAERDSSAKVVSEEVGGSRIEQLLAHKAILDAVARYLRTEHVDANERRKQEFSHRVQEFCTTIGFPGLEDIALDAQLKPRIRQNGKVYTFDELSPGEKVRFVLAFYLALAIVTAEDLDHGAHPGLLLIDTPGKEEMVAGDFEAVVSLLSQIELHHADHIQVIVATSLKAIRGATRVSKQYFIERDDEPVFG